MSGLCSRFRALVGASAYCEAMGKELVVYWPLSDPSKRHGRVPFPVRMSELWEHPYAEVNEGKPHFPKDAAALNGPGDVRFRTCHLAPFVPYMRQPVGFYAGRFQVAGAVREMIRSVLVDMEHPIVGVILRWWARNELTEAPEWFANRMRQIVDVCPDVSFYLAADCVRVDELIHEAFPGRVTSLKHGTDYKYDRPGIMRTLADLHIVAACDWVVGTRRSSYSQMAAFMRGARRVGSISKAASTAGGRYEAADNRASEDEMMQALRRK